VFVVTKNEMDVQDEPESVPWLRSLTLKNHYGNMVDVLQPALRQNKKRALFWTLI
jgi:hypothetical protein